MTDTPPPDYAEIAQEMDQRFKAIATAVDVERELGNSVVVKIIIDTLAHDSSEAIAELLRVSPDDRGVVAQLQARIRIARVVGLALQTPIERGKAAQESLLSEDATAEMHPV